MTNLRIFPLVVLTIVAPFSVECFEITLFEHEYHRGESLKVNIEPSKCYTVRPEWNDRASSIHTHNNCVIIFEDSDCKGKGIRVEPGTPSHTNLGDLDFNDKITAIYGCTRPERECSGVTVYPETSRANDLYELGQKAKRLLERLYPDHCRLLRTASYVELEQFTIHFDPEYKGVAKVHPFGGPVTANAQYYRDHPEDLGSLVHEMGHMISRYGSGLCPVWIVEGVADWLRRQHYEKEKQRKPSRDQYYNRGGEVYFLDWTDRKFKTMKKLVASCREGRYRDALFEQWTGKNLDQLWNQMQDE